MDAPPDASPRGLLPYRLDGGLARALSALSALAAAPHGSAAEALLPALSALLCADVDISLDFALRGGHRPLAALVGVPCAADAAAEAAAAALAHLPPGWGFPVAPAPFFEPLPPPLSFSFGSFLSAPAPSGELLRARLRCAGAEAGAVAEAPAPPPILVRRIPPQAQRQRAQEDVGFLLWPCALPLARWVVAHRGALLGCCARRRVLELGSGVGLVGLVAGIFALPPFCAGRCACAGDGSQHAGVLLTDFNPAVLANLRHNVALNDPARHAAASSDAWGAARLGALAPHARAPLFTATAYDWAAEGGDAGAPLGGAPFHLILGSDIICSDEDAALVARALRRRLAPRGEGVAVVCSPPPFNRWGIAHLPAALAAEGLLWEEHAMPAEFLADEYVGGGAALEGERRRAVERGRALAEEVATGGGVFEEGCRLWVVTLPE